MQNVGINFLLCNYLIKIDIEFKSILLHSILAICCFNNGMFPLTGTESSLKEILSSVKCLSYLFQQTFEAWRIVFLVSAGIYIVAAITFLLLGKFEVQSWNEIPSLESTSKKN